MYEAKDGNPTILDALEEGPKSVAKLSGITGFAMSTLYQRMRVLEAMGKVRASGGNGMTKVYHKVKDDGMLPQTA